MTMCFFDAYCFLGKNVDKNARRSEKRRKQKADKREAAEAAALKAAEEAAVKAAEEAAAEAARKAAAKAAEEAAAKAALSASALQPPRPRISLNLPWKWDFFEPDLSPGEEPKWASEASFVVTRERNGGAEDSHSTVGEIESVGQATSQASVATDSLATV